MHVTGEYHAGVLSIRRTPPIHINLKSISKPREYDGASSECAALQDSAPVNCVQLRAHEAVQTNL
eukprot:5263433-Pyramimonas_sp.AAC.1